MFIGNTSLKKTDGIYFKCEFENPTGSFKDRGIYYQVKNAIKLGFRKAIISSSGNAAISAAFFCAEAGIKLVVFVSPQINKNKLAVLTNSHIEIIKTKSPVKDSFLYSKVHNVYDLRQSKDDSALEGYKNIADEIYNELNDPDAIFIPVSSGTAMVGIMKGFNRLNLIVPVHIVQTDSVGPIASLFDKEFKKKDKSLADAIVSKHPPRKNEVLKIILKNRGSGWVISDKEMEKARSWLLEKEINCSYEGAATLAALWKAGKKGYYFSRPVCILSGKYYG